MHKIIILPIIFCSSLSIAMDAPTTSKKIRTINQQNRIKKKREKRKKQIELRPLLLHAISSNNTGAVESLLKHKANPNFRDMGQDMRRKTPLHIAARKNSVPLCTLLLQYHANVNAKDQNGTTPLMNAAYNQTNDVCRLLLKHEADVNAVSWEGYTALMHASQFLCGNTCVRECLLEHGADLRIGRWNRQNVLKISAPHLQETRVLIAKSRFYPHYTPEELRTAQQRTRARLWVMKQVCPQLPKVMQELILSSNQETWRDACCTPLKIHTKRMDRIIWLPLPVLRILVKHGALEREQVIAKLTAFKMEQLTPLMMDASEAYAASGGGIWNPDSDVLQMLEPENLEEIFGEEIRDNIRAELQPEDEGWIWGCSVQ